MTTVDALIVEAGDLAAIWSFDRKVLMQEYGLDVAPTVTILRKISDALRSALLENARLRWELEEATK